MIDTTAYYYASQSSSNHHPEKDFADTLSDFFKACIQWIRDHFTSAAKLTPERVSVIPEEETSEHFQVVFSNNKHLGLKSSLKKPVSSEKTPERPSINLGDGTYDEVSVRQYYIARNRHTLIRNRFVLIATTCSIDPYATGEGRLYAARAIEEDMRAQQLAGSICF